METQSNSLNCQLSSLSWFTSPVHRSSTICAGSGPPYSDLDLPKSGFRLPFSPSFFPSFFLPPFLLLFTILPSSLVPSIKFHNSCVILFLPRLLPTLLLSNPSVFTHTFPPFHRSLSFLFTSPIYVCLCVCVSS